MGGKEDMAVVTNANMSATRERIPLKRSRLEPLNRPMKTSNIQRPTSNIQSTARWKSLDVGCSMLDVRCSLEFTERDFRLPVLSLIKRVPAYYRPCVGEYPSRIEVNNSPMPLIRRFKRRPAVNIILIKTRRTGGQPIQIPSNSILMSLSLHVSAFLDNHLPKPSAPLDLAALN